MSEHTQSDDSDRWERPYINSEADAVDEAVNDAYEGVMEDPDKSEVSAGYVEFCIEHAAATYQVKHREDDIRDRLYERCDWLPLSSADESGGDA